MAQATTYKRSMAGSIGAGMKSVFGGSGRRYYVLEHKVSSKYHKAGENQEIIVDQIEMGRNPSCQVRFDESFDTVSRRHAAIVRDGDNWKLVQLSQTNSTYLNGQKVEKEKYLRNGDEIQLSTNGPRMGFIIPEGDKGLVKSIGLTARLNLFRKQALRPYKQAITAMACILVLCVGIGSYFIVKQHEMIENYRAENVRLSDDFNDKIRAQEEKNAQEREAWEEESRRQQQLYQREIAKIKNETSRAINAAVERLKREGRASRGFDAMLSEQNIPKDVYFLQTTKVVYIENGQEHQIMDGENAFGWSGTGFLLNDGRFVTARHCVEGWLYNGNPVGEDHVSTVARAAATNPNIKVKAYFIALSTISNNKFTFSSDDFIMNRSLDRTVQIGTDDSGHPVNWRFTFPAIEGMSELMWATDWAYTTKTNGHRGNLVMDANLSRNLMPMQKLVASGFPVGLGVMDGSQQIDPISVELTTSRRGLANNGCILHSRGTDHGNSGGPIFAVKDGKLVVVGIVSRGDHRTKEHKWAIPICNIQ